MGKLKVFIVWSGELSQTVGKILRHYIPSVINDVEPFMSEADIAKGAQWPGELWASLGDSGFGLVCLTPENVNVPWVNFEAGFLSRTYGKARVCPILFGGLRDSDVRPPLSLFQMVRKPTEEEYLDLMRSINAVLDADSLSEELLTQNFGFIWPELSSRIGAAEGRYSGQPALSAPRDPQDVQEEILSIVRQLGSRRDAPPTDLALALKLRDAQDALRRVLFHSLALSDRVSDPVAKEHLVKLRSQIFGLAERLRAIVPGTGSIAADAFATLLENEGVAAPPAPTPTTTSGG